MNKYEKYKEMLDALNDTDSEGRLNCIKAIRVKREREDNDDD